MCWCGWRARSWCCATAVPRGHVEAQELHPISRLFSRSGQESTRRGLILLLCSAVLASFVAQFGVVVVAATFRRLFPTAIFSTTTAIRCLVPDRGFFERREERRWQVPRLTCNKLEVYIATHTVPQTDSFFKN